MQAGEFVDLLRLGNITVRTSHLGSKGRGFNSRSGRYQLVTTLMGDCLRTGKSINQSINQYSYIRACQNADLNNLQKYDMVQYNVIFSQIYTSLFTINGSINKQ